MMDGSGTSKGLGAGPLPAPGSSLAAPEHEVWIVEGEKDADRLASLGFIATTNAVEPESGGVSFYSAWAARRRPT